MRHFNDYNLTHKSIKSTYFTMNTNIGYHVDGFYRDLVRHLEDNGSSVAVSKKFSTLLNNADRVTFVLRLLDDYQLLRVPTEDSKNDELAEEYKRQGNEYYRKKKIKEAIECYTNSIAYAKEKSEVLALAFANRSAALFEKKFYEDCLKVSLYENQTLGMQ